MDTARTTAERKRTAHQRTGMTGGKRIVVTLNDYRRLKSLIEARRRTLADPHVLWLLEQKLEHALLFRPEYLPAGAISIYSTVRFENETAAQDYTYTLVFPGEANIIEGKLSVLSPIGSALLGQSVGDTVLYRAPGGLESLRIHELVYQPEAAGQY